MADEPAVKKESIQPTPPSSDAPQTKGRPLIIGGGKPMMMGAGVGVSLTMAVRPQMANVATGGSSGKMSSQAGGGQLAWRKPKAQGARGAHAQTQPYSLRPTFGGARAPPPPPPMMTQPDIWKNSNANGAAASPLTLLAARNPLPPVMTDRAAMAPAPAYDDILASPRVENNTLAVKVLPFATQRKVAFAGKREQEQQHAGVRIDEGAVMETTITPSIAPKPDGMSYINLLHTLRRYPHSTDFVYLRQVQADENRYNPYALEVVPFSAIDADKTYYTLSARGMTMYSNGAKDADFTTLGTWEREFQLFHAMRCLRVFNHFRMWKGLITWRNSVRRNKIGKARQRLEENLFSLNPVFQGSVRQIMDLCSNFATTRLHKIATGRTYTLEEFKLGHREHLAEVAETVTNLGEMTRETVLKACRVVLKELEDRTNAFYADRDESKMLPSERIASQREGGVKASKSDFAFTIAATRRSEQRKLVHFVRMVDFMICNTLSSMLHESVYDVLDTIRGARECHEFYHPRQRHESEVDDEEEDDDDDDVHGDLDDEMNADADHQNEEGMPPAEAAGEEPSNGNATDAVAEGEVPIDEAGAAAAASADSEVPSSEEPTPLQQEGEQEQEEEEERVHPRGGVDMAPLFTIEVLLDESHTSLQLVPGVEEVDGELQDILKEFKSTLAMFPRLTESEEITELTRGKAPKESDESAQTNGGVVAVATSGGAEDEITPLDEILEDETYTTLMSGVQEEMELGLEAAEDGRESFQPFTEIVNENRALDSDELRTSFIGGTRTLEDFRSDIREFREQRKRIEDLPTTTNLGMYSLNSHRLKDLFLPSPIDCLEKLFAVLPRIGSELYSALIEKVHTSTSKLNQALNNVEDFVEVVNFSEELKAVSTEMYQEYDRVESVYRLCEEFEIPVPEIERAAVQTLEGDYNAMLQALENVDTTMEENVTRFSGELEAAADAVRKAVKKIVVNTEDERILSDDSDSAEVIEFMQTIRDEVEEQRSDAQRVIKYQRLFKIMESEFEELDALHDDVEVKYSLWAGSRDWKELTEAWIATPFEAMDMADFEEKLQVYGKASFKCEKNLPRNGVSTKYKEAVQVYKDIYPCVESMRNKALKERHWTAIETIVNKPITRDENFTLGVVIEYNMMAFKDEIMAISTEATQEAALEDLLDKVKSRWATIDFQFLPYKDSKDTYILGGIDDIMVALEDSLMTMQTILASRFVAGIRDSVEAVDKQLNLFSDTLDEWLAVQRAWMYLDVIFSAPDIQRQLPNESKAFFNVDKQLKEIMKRARDKGNALQSGTTPGWLEILQRANETLEKVQKNLEDYLETKRMAFPRFYFLSNDELLEILAQTKNVQAVQPHMSKCFDGIKSLDFGRDPKSIDIFAMNSAEGESVSLGKNLKARGNVEMWLGQVEQAMQMNLKRLAKQAFVDYPTVPRPEWVLQQPAQIVLAISQHYWVQDVEAAIQSEDCVKSLHEFLDVNISQLSDLSRVVRGDLSNLHRKIVVALITIDVHARDIVESLEAEKCENLNDFIWQMQLRYFWDEEADNLFVKQTNATFAYMYEYLGAQSRLVVTPMTDRCYMTLTGALHLKFGGAPAGPAGTGKTETTKDLGKALGVQCVVFNCGDNLDYKFMAKFFSGLAQCGAWACFDEFNRIDIEVLSVVAQQLLTIQNALKAEVSKFNFEGKEIRLIPTFGCFITMNPGYAGRTELPDNLKALFRPMAMMIPDYALVAEVMLYAEGFETSKSLSRKMVKLYKLSSEQLSQQDHYDFGMRALKSVLVMAGSLKRANPDDPEDVTLIRAMRDSNIPKFLKEDAALFRAIVEDLFPGVEVPLNDYGDLQKAVEASLLAAGKQVVDDFVLKTIQLHETFNVRFGVMLVGPTGGGKTVVYETLKAAMTMLREQKHKDDTYQVTHTYTFNPKCIKMGELYGEYNLMTNEWTDGLGSTLIRNAVADTTKDRKWVVFDGPVDAIWIENMNTVLDDNCTLCLPNGERIKLNPVTMRMLFEVQDLSVASPATVSRCGMVYVPPEELGWRPFVQSWVARDLPEAITPELRAHIFNLFDTLVDAGLSFVATKRHSGIPTVDINLVTSLCYIMQSFFLPTHGINFASPPEELNPIIGRVFAFSYVWSIGANVHADSHDELDDFVREHLQPVCQFPGGGSVMDYVLDFTTPEVPLVQWTVPEFVYDLNTPFFQLIVPTIDTVRFGYLIETLLDVQRPVLYTGETGVGKSVIVDSTLKRLSNDKGVVPTTLNFSAQTQAIDVQFSIEAKLEKKRKTRFGAPPNKRNAFFVDDVNMPAKETYGAQPPVELLRLFIDRGGLYDRGKGLYWKTVEDTVVVCACGPPGGGRNDLSPRFVRCFTTVCVPPPSENALKVIFGSILRGFITDIGFKEEFKSVVDPIVNSTVDMFGRVLVELLPTPSKPVYLFNSRDIGKIVQGILMIKPGPGVDKETMGRLWVHESMRVFGDRLVGDVDKEYFCSLVSELGQKNFSGTDMSKSALFEEQTIMFCEFLKMGLDPEDRLYEEAKDMDKTVKILEDYLEEYNFSSTTQMSLVFFVEAVENISRISRVLRQPRGNAMLIGVGGSGKQSLTRFAAHMAGQKCFSIELTRGYNADSFREDLRSLYRTAGIDGKSVTFLMTDNQVLDESFLEMCNGLLNSGDVPGLFPDEEKLKLYNEIRPLAEKAGSEVTKDALWRFFINSVLDRLHTVLTMSPVGDKFAQRCRAFPSLVNCCALQQIQDWPKDALLSVSKRFLGPVDLGGAEVNESICEMCTIIHRSVLDMSVTFYNELRRKYYVTPKSYLDLISLYQQQLAMKREEYGVARDRLLNGLQKLAETNDVVDTMQTELNDLQPILKEKSAATEVLKEQVSKDQAEAEKVAETVGKEEAIVKEQAAETKAIADDAQADLDKAMPALEAAVNSLKSLNKGDITEIKSFPKPPALVQMTMEAVCVLLQQKPDWDTAKKVLSDNNFLKSLQDFDKDNIPPAVIKKLKKYVDDESFVPETVEKQSRAAKSLCMWCRAMDVYSAVAKDVEPKRQALQAAQDTLAKANAELAEKQAQLKAVLDNVDGLKSKLAAAEAESKSLQDQTDLAAARLQRAGKLTSALADEQVRWQETADKIGEDTVLLTGDVFLGSAAISYFGAFTGTYRNQIVANWLEEAKERKIPISSTFSLQRTLSSPIETREWAVWGLPTDAVSTDNGVLVTRGKRWPLMIDPQNQANRWVKTMEAKSGLRAIKLTDGNYLRTLENAIRIGNPVLLEDVTETLDPALEPILQKAVFVQGGRKLIRLGDTDVDYDPNFKFYITTKMPNPHLLPEICIKVTLINFTVTQIGLEDQLLGDVVRKERPDLEEAKDRLVVSIANDKKQLKDLEDKILKMLKESEGNILDNETLINTLQNSKLTSGMIQGRVEEAEVTEREINEARESYRQAATRGSIIYFVIADLALIGSMYQYSLVYFMNLYNLCIDNSEKDDDVGKRLQNLCEYVTFFMYNNVCRGLFEDSKALYSFLLCSAIERHAGSIPPASWNLLLRGTPASYVSLKENPMPDRLGEDLWTNIEYLAATIPAFSELIDSFGSDSDRWLAILDSDEPHNEELPARFTAEKVDEFHKMMLMKVLREEKLVFAVSRYVGATLGQRFVEALPWTLDEVFPDTNSKTPVVFVLSTGADPTSMLLRFAERMNMTPGERLKIISLGQGQGPIAEQLITEAMKSGDWVALQNCHVASSWMLSLSRIVEALANDDTVHKDFRLWLTSMPAKIFPVVVLQQSIKLTFEPPKGVRANVARTYKDMDGEFFESCTKPQPFKKLVFSLAFFHAVIQERRKFGPLGWNIRYEFNTSDLDCSFANLKMFIDEQPEIPFPALLYVIGQINYGGRVTDDLDRRCLMSILEVFLNPRAVDDDYKFTKSGTYYAPPEGPLDDYRNYLSSLPMTEAPEVFGMHDNANITFQFAESRRLMETVLSIQPRVSAAEGGLTPEEQVEMLSLEILKGLPEPLLYEEAAEGMFDRNEAGQLTSMANVLNQEMIKFNRLHKALKTTLGQIGKAIKGLIVMTNELEGMFHSLLNNQVPGLWSKVAYPSLKPLASWIKDFNARMTFMRQWLVEGDALKSYSLPALFFPQGFMTGVLQTHARKYKIAIDTLNFEFTVLKTSSPEDLEEGPEDGVLIHGLYIDNGRWDAERMVLDEALPGEMFSTLPIVHFIPAVNYKIPATMYECPLYKTSVRAGVLSTTGASTNYVVSLGLPIADHTTPSFWVLQGTATLCALDT